MALVKNGTLRLDIKNGLIFWILVFISVISIIVILLSETPKGYELLFILPTSYIVFLFASLYSWNKIPENIGITVLYFLIFFRMVIAPALKALGGYPEEFRINTDENEYKAILLMVYELFAIWGVLKIEPKQKQEKRVKELSGKRLKKVLLIFTAVVIFFCIVAPEIPQNYRTIFGVSKEAAFTSVEQSDIIDAYATSSIKKFLLVTCNYLIIIARLFIPGALIVLLSYKKTTFRKILSIILILSEFFMVDGAIARTIIYVLILMLLYFKLYNINIRKVYSILLIGVVFVIFYFISRFAFKHGMTAMYYYGKIANTYFSGDNVVSGGFNIVSTIGEKIGFLINIIISSIPFQNTIFNMNLLSISKAFNSVNFVKGQIIPTISISYNIFGWILSPILSIIACYYCKKFGEKASNEKNPIRFLCYTSIAILSAMSIVMYNVNIVLGWIIQIPVPILLMNLLIEKKNEQEN